MGIVAEPKDQRQAWDRSLLRLIWNNVWKSRNHSAFLRS